MDIEECKSAYEGLKKNAFIVESIDKEFFLKFGETVLNELEKYEKQLDLDYVENELDKKDKIIKELKEKIEYLEKENKVVRIFKESMPKDTEIVVITKENYEKNFKEED